MIFAPFISIYAVIFERLQHRGMYGGSDSLEQEEVRLEEMMQQERGFELVQLRDSLQSKPNGVVCDLDRCRTDSYCEDLQEEAAVPATVVFSTAVSAADPPGSEAATMQCNNLTVKFAEEITTVKKSKFRQVIMFCSRNIFFLIYIALSTAIIVLVILNLAVGFKPVTLIVMIVLIFVMVVLLTD